MQRFLSSLCLTILAAIPISASQFRDVAFDEVTRGSAVIVRGTLENVRSEWNSDREIIFTYANVRVSRYLAGFGPTLLHVREVGGTVNGYTQQAIGFPELREGEEVVLFLAKWDDSEELRIHEYRKGKYVAFLGADGTERVRLDPVGQGDEPMSRQRFQQEAMLTNDSMSLDELQRMITNARLATESGPRNRID